MRQRNEIALAVASSGIAATLLTGGRVLQECKLWDECTMSHKAAFQALDVTLKDLKRNNERMGEVTMGLAGDFRQTLPVIPRGTRVDEIQACVKSSYIWKGIQRLRLSTNM